MFEQDMRVFNTGDGFLGSVGYLLALFFWLYALIPLVNVVRFAGNEIASSRGNMLELLIRDVPLALIRAAGYIAALIALFSAIGYTITWLTSINLGVGSNVWGDARLIDFCAFENFMYFNDQAHQVFTMSKKMERITFILTWSNYYDGSSHEAIDIHEQLRREYLPHF